MQATPSWTNERWISGLNGANAHTGEAYEALLTFLLRGLRHALRDRPEAIDHAEDFAQEAMVRILRDLKHFRGQSRFTTWAFSIALRTAIDDLRRKKWKDVSLDALLASGEQYHPSTMVRSNAALERERIHLLLHSLINTRLTLRQRKALMAELEEVPQAEIARELGLTRNALYKLTHDARKVLKVGLVDAGIRIETLTWALSAEE